MSLDAIPLSHYQKYVKVVDDNKDNQDQEFLSLKLLNIFCGITMKQAYELPISEYETILKHLSELLTEKSILQRRFYMTDPKGKKIEFGFIPNLDKMSLGEYIDAEK